MSSSYLYIRKVGIKGTKVLETTRKNALAIIKANRKSDYQIGILGGRNLDVIKRVYGEFAPFIEVETEKELTDTIK